MDVRFSSIRPRLSFAAFVGFAVGLTLQSSLVATDSRVAQHAPEFVHLNYSRMSADEAFEGETLLVAMTVPESYEGLRPSREPSSEQEAAPGQAASPTPPVDKSANFAAPMTPPAQGVSNIPPRSSLVAIRSLQSVNLFEATAARSEAGVPLAVPQSVVASTGHSVEEQFVPLPWHRSHPPRNTFRFRNQPLYFEDPNLERCGDSYGCFTEAVSIAHFAGRIPLLPYMMASDNPHKTVPALKDCPTGCSFGSEAYLPRPTVKAIAVEAAAVTGFIFVIP